MLEIKKDKKSALLFGATGLVGSFCLKYLLENPAYQKVLVFSRRPIDTKHAKLEVKIIDFNKLDSYAKWIKGDDLYCCLGTTLRKAGSRSAFYKVDFTYSYEIARIAAENKVNQYLLVSSVGADKDSVFFYSQVKGELEEAVKQLPFWGIHVFQPSMLLGERDEIRIGEQIAARLSRGLDFFLGNLLSKYRPVEAETVARAMIYAAQQLRQGIHTYPSHHLHNLANEEYIKQAKLN